ncbi:MAG: acetylxylan esterase [Pirellulales bacterium]
MRNRRFALSGLCLLLIAAGACRLVAAEENSPVNALPEVADLPQIDDFPKLLKMFDGREVDSPEMWRQQRRPELRRLVEHYYYGYAPPAPENVSFKVTAEDPNYFDGAATRKLVIISYGPEGTPALHLLLVVPNGDTPAPVFVATNFCGNHALLNDPAIPLNEYFLFGGCDGCKDGRATEAARGTRVDRWRIHNAIRRGYAIATFCCADLDPDRNDPTDGVQPHFYQPGQTAPGAHDWGSIRAWAWGISRVIDYLVTDETIDRERICVTGHSRMGKAALVAGAFDERIAVTIPHQAGCGGSAPNRYNRGESLKVMNDRFPHWLTGECKKFNDDVTRLPFDQDALVGLIAPRAVLFTNGKQDEWADPKGQFNVLWSGAKVHEFLGAEGLAADEMPPPGKLIDSNVGYYIRDSKHLLDVDYWNVFFDFADKRFGK